MAARCETVLNTTMAEMDTYHTQKLEDFQELTKEYLDGEIALYEQVRPSSVSPSTTLSPPLTAAAHSHARRSSSACAVLVRRSTSHSTTRSRSARDCRRSTSESSSSHGLVRRRCRNRVHTCSTQRRCVR